MPDTKDSFGMRFLSGAGGPALFAGTLVSTKIAFLLAYYGRRCKLISIFCTFAAGDGLGKGSLLCLQIYPWYEWRHQYFNINGVQMEAEDLLHCNSFSNSLGKKPSLHVSNRQLPAESQAMMPKKRAEEM